MIIFLYGEDTYRSRQKLNEIKNKAKELVICDNFTDLRKAQEANSLFGQRKVIVIDCRDAINRVSMMDEFAEIEDSEDIIVFWAEKPDKRSKLFKKLLKIAQCQEFNLLNHWQLVNWIKEHSRIEPRAAEKLALAVGNDLWQMENEINKLICYTGDQYPIADRISDRHIDLLIRTQISTNIFRTIQAIKKRDKKIALRLLYEHLSQGDDEWFVFNMLIWQFRNSIKKRQWSGLKPAFDHLLKIDVWAKTGKIEQPATCFALLFSS